MGYMCDNKFLGRSSSLSLYNLPEGNSLAAAEFVRLVEVSDLPQQNNQTGRQRIDSYLGPTVELNPIRTQNIVQNGTQHGTVVSGVPPPGTNPRTIYKHLYLC